MSVLEFMRFTVAVYLVAILAVDLMTMAAIAMVTTLTGLAVVVLVRACSTGRAGNSSYQPRPLDATPNTRASQASAR